MADPFSLATGVVGFVGFALQVAATVADFVQNAKDFPEEFTKLASRTEDFATLARRLEPAIKVIEGRYKTQPESNTAAMAVPSMAPADASQPAPQQMTALGKCHDVLKRIHDLLKSGKEKSFKSRLSWAFSKKRKVEELFNELGQCNSVLSLAFNNEALLIMIAEFSLNSQEREAQTQERKEAKEMRNLVKIELDEKQRENILRWLWSGDSFNARHQEVKKSHLDKSGMWLLSDLHDWLNGQGPRLILCIGAAGVGKTYLAYKLIQHLLDLNPREYGLAYIYFEHKQTQTRTLSNYIASILRQLEERKQQITASVQSAYDALSSKNKNPELETLKALLVDSLESFKLRSILVLDAFDEYSADGWQELVEVLEVLLSSQDRIFVFISSRPNSHLDNLAKSFPTESRTINVDANKGAQSEDLRSFLEESLARIRMKNFDDREKINVSRGITEKAKGSFLLARLHLESVLAWRTPSRRRTALQSLPETLEEAYEMEMERLRRKNKGDYEIAKRTLSWIYWAKRSLHMAELREAISVDPIVDIENGDEECSDLDRENFTEPVDILDCCGGLVLWERSTDIVGFSHYTVSEFFAKNMAGNIEPELYVARTCLTYLCFDIFGQGACGEKAQLRSRAQKYRLAQYIAKFCGSHTLESKEGKCVEDLVLSILWSPARRHALQELEENSRLIENEFDPFRKYGDDFGGWTSLHFLAAWGLADIFNVLPWNSGSELVSNLIQKWRYRDSDMSNAIALSSEDLQVNAKSMDSTTPLSIAAGFGYVDVVKLLLSHGADVAARDRWQQTALHRAAGGGHKEAVALLLNKMDAADVAARDVEGQTALHRAAGGGHRDAVALLLGHMDAADVVARDTEGQTALHWAAANGYADAVALLLGHMGKADVAAKDQWQKTALHWAAANGHEDAVALLLENGADVGVKDEWKYTALHLAAMKGHGDVVKLLLRHMGGADVAVKDEWQRTALHQAAANGRRDAVVLLLSHMTDGDVVAKDKWGYTALHYAARNGHRDVVALLLAKMSEADVAVKDKYGRTALHYGAKNGHPDVVALLLSHMTEAAVAAKDEDGSTALHLAASDHQVQSRETEQEREGIREGRRAAVALLERAMERKGEEWNRVVIDH